MCNSIRTINSIHWISNREYLVVNLSNIYQAYVNMTVFMRVGEWDNSQTDTHGDRQTGIRSYKHFWTILKND